MCQMDAKVRKKRGAKRRHFLVIEDLEREAFFAPHPHPVPQSMAGYRFKRIEKKDKQNSQYRSPLYLSHHL